jgi:hypothetical protein
MLKRCFTEPVDFFLAGERVNRTGLALETRHEFFYPYQCLSQLLPRDCVRATEVVFPTSTKHTPGNNSDSLFF